MPKDLEGLSYIATIVASVVATGVGFMVLYQLKLARDQMDEIRKQVQTGTEALQVARDGLEKTAESLVISAQSAEAAQSAAVEARRSADAAQLSVVEAERSADAAQQSVVEAARARIDAVSPYLVVLVDKPDWPPYWDTTTSADIQNSVPHRLNADEGDAIETEQLFYYPGDLEGFLWYRVRGIVRNEGTRSALVTLDGDARFIRSQSRLAPRGTIFEVPPINYLWRGPNRAYAGHRYLLEPGQAAVFEWAAGAPMSQAWDSLKTQHPFTDTLSVVGFSVNQLTRDEVRIQFGAWPLAQVPGRDGAGKLSDSTSAAPSIQTMPREYPGLEFRS